MKQQLTQKLFKQTIKDFEALIKTTNTVKSRRWTMRLTDDDFVENHKVKYDNLTGFGKMMFDYLKEEGYVPRIERLGFLEDPYLVVSW